MWKITVHKSAKAQQELRVKLLLNEMAGHSFTTYAESFIENFKQRVQEIPRTNNFSADLLYKAIQGSSHKSVEIWKMTPSSDFKHKMWTLDYVAEDNGNF